MKEGLPKGALPDEEAEEAAAAQVYGTKKKGLNDSDVAALVAALRSGLSWEEAKQQAGSHIEDVFLEKWKPTIQARAETPSDRPVLPAKPAPRPAAVVAASPPSPTTPEPASVPAAPETTSKRARAARKARASA
jgi:translation initiation factor IF-2